MGEYNFSEQRSPKEKKFWTEENTLKRGYDFFAWLFVNGWKLIIWSVKWLPFWGIIWQFRLSIYWNDYYNRKNRSDAFNRRTFAYSVVFGLISMITGFVLVAIAGNLANTEVYTKTLLVYVGYNILLGGIILWCSGIMRSDPN